MIKLTFINILGYPDSTLDFKKGFTNCKRGFVENCLEVYGNRANHLKNNLRLNEISILIFFQFYCKIKRKRLEIVVETTYDLHPN